MPHSDVQPRRAVDQLQKAEHRVKIIQRPKPLREKLSQTCFITAPVVERRQVDAKDGTIKYLWRLGDGSCIETLKALTCKVLLPVKEVSNNSLVLPLQERPGGVNWA